MTLYRVLKSYSINFVIYSLENDCLVFPLNNQLVATKSLSCNGLFSVTFELPVRRSDFLKHSSIKNCEKILLNSIFKKKDMLKNDGVSTFS